MTNKRLREIAALAVELAMTEAHARKLSTMVPNASYRGEGSQMMALLKEENERAEALRQKIRILKDRP
jgi:hypothetical protein